MSDLLVKPPGVSRPCALREPMAGLSAVAG